MYMLPNFKLFLQSCLFLHLIRLSGIVAPLLHLDAPLFMAVHLAIAIACHYVLRQHFTLGLNEYQINNVTEFIPLPRWLIPGDKNELTADAIEHLDKAFSGLPEVRNILKEASTENGSLTVYDYCNAAFLMSQLAAKRAEAKRLAAMERFTTEEG